MSEHDAPYPEDVTQLPLFPLGTVLFPGALLPLQLFELRYLQMIGECERQGTGFGVVTLSQGREVHRPGEAAEQFEAMGTRVQIERIERPQPGLVMVWCRGVEKFRIEATQQRSDGLWTQRGAPLGRGLAATRLQLAVQPLGRIASLAFANEIPPVCIARALGAAGIDRGHGGPCPSNQFTARPEAVRKLIK